MAKHVDKDLLREALECIGIGSVVEFYSPETRTRGNIMLFICPFHNDTKLGSTMAYLDKNDFCCHACDVGGPVDKLAVQFAKKMHPQDANNFDAILDHIVEDLNIPRETVVRGNWNGEHVKKEVVDETLYFNLFGTPYMVLEKEFAPVTLPNKKAIRVPTNVEKIYYKTLFIRDRKMHDHIILVKARSVFQNEVERLTVAQAEELMDKQISILKKILKVSALPEEETFRKNIIARKKAIDAFIARKNGGA